ncbi:MAG: ChuX/HutX family heme-like substrate-binding protein [Woeseiaceae bacterium]|nr:ChuX/HutX family heme-like substrate-binding protein [Woeseiaceae bacterium]
MNNNRRCAGIGPLDRRLSSGLRLAVLAVTVATASLFSTVARAGDLCASESERREVAAFYDENPGVLPTIAARRLQMSEAVVVSALPPSQAVSAPGSAFAEVWTAMGTLREATFLIVKGNNIFEVLSAIGEGKPSERSQYYNIAYTQPLRGHLRPDEYAAIWVIDFPQHGDDPPPRGIAFYAADGSLVFGAFISGDAMRPDDEELAKFEAVKSLVAAHAPVCTTRVAETRSIR